MTKAVCITHTVLALTLAAWCPMCHADSVGAKGNQASKDQASLLPRVGMSRKDALKVFPQLLCQTNETCIDILPAFPIAGMPAFVQITFDSNERVVEITVRFHRKWSNRFLSVAKHKDYLGEGFDVMAAPTPRRALTGMRTKRSEEEADARADCPQADGTEYVHGIWRNKTSGQTVEFWSFTGRTCSARLIYTKGT